jgi:hypothetical protein
MMPGVMQQSAPPETTTSAVPYWIARNAAPIASVELVHPVDSTWLSPRRPKAMDTSLESMPTNAEDTAKG